MTGHGYSGLTGHDLGLVQSPDSLAVLSIHRHGVNIVRGRNQHHLAIDLAIKVVGVEDGSCTILGEL
jgi:hypothetical protein